MKTSRTRSSLHRYLRLLLVVIAMISCLFVIRTAARQGLSKALITYSLTAGNLTAAKKAIQITPNDAEAHLAAAEILATFGTPDQAVPELERAVALRPAHCIPWLQLGLVRDQIGDTAGSLKAFDEAIRHAPFYFLPRWDRGNVLLRSGQYEAAFNDLNQAADSNPELIPSLLDLAWGISRGNVELTEQLAQINNVQRRMAFSRLNEELARVSDDQRRIAFARLLVRLGKAPEAIAQLGKVVYLPEKIKAELVDQLLAKGAFKEAFGLWKVKQAVEPNKEPAVPSIYDGGFEGPLSLGGSGFAWRVPRALQATSVSFDSGQPHSGSKDLRIEFNGDSNPQVTMVSQVILVEPSKRYKINFASRSQDVVSGGLPLVVVTDASAEVKRLGQSPPLATGTTSWQVYSFEVTTTPQTNAVVLRLQRESCPSSPCPIFGSISLDSFSVEQLN